MNSHKVSIVVPTFNQGEYLPITLDWILHQTYPNLEIIVIDGGSVDGTKGFLAKFEERWRSERADYLERVRIPENGQPEFHRRTHLRYPQEGRDVQIVAFDRNIGATQTYNEGFRRITGDFCTYVVGDDIPHLDMISRLVDRLETTGADFAYADMAVVDDAGRILQVLRKPEYSFEACFARWFHLGVARLYRSIWHRRVGLFDTAYESANDYDMYLRFAMAGCRFVHIPEVLYSVRHHGAERTTGQHSREGQKRLFAESVRSASRAQAWLQATVLDRENRK